jgi:hypothetical protein
MADPRPEYPTRVHLDNWFSYHSPVGDQQARYQAIRDAAHNLATVILDACPSSADRTDAIREIRKAVMIANASIACGGQ